MEMILERIEQEAGVPGLVTILAERLSPTDLQSVLLEVYRLHSRRLTPSALLTQYRANRFVRPSGLSPVKLIKWEQVAYSQLPEDFEAILLSPVCPLGTNTVVAPVDQNWSLVTVRNTEVVSDSTNVLALECAVRRQDHLAGDPKSAHEVHLAASHRLLRAQMYRDPDLLSHFSAFALCSAGRDVGRWDFEVGAIHMHLRFYIRALRAFLGDEVRLHVRVTDFSQGIPLERIEAELLSSLRHAFPGVECDMDDQRTSGMGYYTDLCFHLYATNPAGERMELVDGGSVDWTQKLLNNAKERLFISGIGSERLCSSFDGSLDH